MANKNKLALAAGNKTRIQGVSTEQNVSSSTSGVLYNIVATNANAAAQSFILLDGTTTLGTYEVPPDTTISLYFNAQFDTDIRVNPGSTDIDMLLMWD